MDVIRNYPNQVFHEWSVYLAFHRSLLRKDVLFLREDFTGDVNQACLALQQYVDAFRAREIADQLLREYMDSIGDTGIASWDHENHTTMRTVITPEQEETREVFREAWRRCLNQQRVKRTELLTLMYATQRDEDEDEDTYGHGVDEDGVDEDDNNM